MMITQNPDAISTCTGTDLRAISAQGIQPTTLDVLTGRNKIAFMHPGNQLYRELIQRHREAYQRTHKRTFKSIVVRSIMRTIQDKGGRFLRPVDETTTSHDETTNVLEATTWIEMSKAEIHTKISHALRSAKPSGQPNSAPSKRRVAPKSSTSSGYDSSAPSMHDPTHSLREQVATSVATTAASASRTAEEEAEDRVAAALLARQRQIFATFLSEIKTGNDIDDEDEDVLDDNYSLLSWDDPTSGEHDHSGWHESFTTSATNCCCREEHEKDLCARCSTR
jgi:hypothetical protein